LVAEARIGPSAWVLAGGEGRRVQGLDKGLLPRRGQPLEAWVLAQLAPQVSALGVVANRNLVDHGTLLAAACMVTPDAQPASLGVIPDDPAWPPRSGPLAGILTALAHSPGDWVLISPCDTPELPHDLVQRLAMAALAEEADIAVPCTTDASGTQRHHWVCVLMHKRVEMTIRGAFMEGERKVRQAIARCKWTGVSFPDSARFHNINSLETLYGGD
jgi:molybdopterin-guanine dinucleotide biosynthesis protein A